MSSDPSIQGPYMSALSTQAPLVAPSQSELFDPQAQYKTELSRQYAPFIKSVQTNRRTIENLWLQGLDAWKAKHRRQGFHGEWFNHYIPAARKAIEKSVIRSRQMLFTSPDSFEVYPADDRRLDLGIQAEGWKNYLLWRMTRIDARGMVDQLIRCLLLYQRCVAKSALDFEDIPGQVWPSARVVDPFTFYVWPETATSTAQCQVVFENTMMPFSRYSWLAKQGGCDVIAPGDLTAPEWPYYYTERLSASGLPTPTDTGASTAPKPEIPLPDPQKLVSMTELWRRDGPAWTQIWVVWNVTGGPKVTRVKENAFFPYHMAIGRALPGEHYTSSMMSDLEPLNVLLNDQINMTLEGQATAILPIAVVNPDLVARAETLVFKPRAKWLADPAGVEFKTAVNTAPAGYQGVQATFGLIDSFAGSSPLAEGQPARGMPRAGFAVSSLIGLATSDIRNVAELIEDKILTPMLQAFYKLTCQSQIILSQAAQIPGAEALKATQINPGALAGAYSFKWIGTLQANDQQVRGQRLLTLLNIAGKLYPAMSQQGWELDFGTLFKRIWRDGIGERGADTIVYKKAPQPPPPPPPPPPPKVSVSLSGDVDPMTAHVLAIQGQQPQRPPATQLQGQAQGAAAPRPGGGGAVAPAPATPEQSERQMSRGMAESNVGQMMAGTGVG